MQHVATYWLVLLILWVVGRVGTKKKRGARCVHVCADDMGNRSLASLEAGPAQGLVVSLYEAALDVGVARAAAEMPRVPIPGR